MRGEGGDVEGDGAWGREEERPTFSILSALGLVVPSASTIEERLGILVFLQLLFCSELAVSLQINVRERNVNSSFLALLLHTGHNIIS